MIERIAIESREQWLACRSQDVTASIAGSLLGVHPYSTAYGLWLLKKGLIQEDPEEAGPMRRGRLLEPVAVQMLREDRPDWTIEEYPIGYYYRDPAVRIGATPDVFAMNEHGKPGIIQLKSIEPSVFRREWKTESGMVEPPLWIVVQAILETYLTGREWAAVAPLVVGFGTGDCRSSIFRSTPASSSASRSRSISSGRRIERGENYPADYARDGSLIARLYPKDNGIEIDLSGDNALPEYVDLLESARSRKKTAETDEKTAKAAISERMGEAAIARIADGRRISNKSQNRNVGCKHMPGLFCSQSDFRVMRLVKGR